MTDERMRTTQPAAAASRAAPEPEPVSRVTPVATPSTEAAPASEAVPAPGAAATSGAGLARLDPTSTQTVGPFFENALLREPLNVLVRPETDGERIRIGGRLLDGDGTPVPDAIVEIWQANVHGRYNHPLDQRELPLDPHFTGFGRCGTDADGRFWFETIKPGPVPFGAERTQAPHLSLTVAARGLLNHLATRLYFADNPANEDDPVLTRVPASRRATLLARREESAGIATYQLDIVLQGRGETVFFNL